MSPDDPELEPPNVETPLEEGLRESGLFGLFVYSSLGFLLELLHAFKVDAYLNANEETRRLLLRLGHAHGTLLSLVLLVLGAHLRALARTRRLEHAVVGLRLAHVLLPVGFLAGGLTATEGDPGALGALIPVGAAVFVVALALFVTNPREKK